MELSAEEIIVTYVPDEDAWLVFIDNEMVSDHETVFDACTYARRVANVHDLEYFKVEHVMGVGDNET